MGDFFGEFIGAIAESVLDLIGKSKPDIMPGIEYKSEFIVKHKSSQIFAKCILSIAIIIISIICFIFTHNDTENSPLFIIFAVLGVLTLLPAIYASLYKCKIDEKTLVRCEMFKKKTYNWSDIVCVRKIETTNQHSLTIALYNKNGKLIFDCATDMGNAWYILKMAEAKGIEIREEKDLTIKQLNHL